MDEVQTQSAEPRALTVLFVCTHNRCRSILCEVLTRHLSNGVIEAFSAGSQPSGAIHPDTLRQLAVRGFDTADLRSKSWETYDDRVFDAVITVCDDPANEQCPLWLGETTKVHWGLPDPTRVSDEQERDRVFEAVISTIKKRIERLLLLDLAALRGTGLRDALQTIGNEEH